MRAPKTPRRATLALVAASLMSTFWLGASIAGLHPDGAILGFAGTMYAIWATAEHSERLKREIENREQEVEQQEIEQKEDRGETTT
jgi:purine nucleoside permease